MTPATFALLIWILFPFPLIFLWLRNRSKTKKCEQSGAEIQLKLDGLIKKYSPATSLEDEISHLEAEVADTGLKTQKVRAEYSEKRQLLNKLRQEVAVYDEKLSFAELGVYEPHFDFGDSATFKTSIKDVRAKQKAMVSAKKATICPADWTVEGSRAKGQTMINRQTRLTMRAFNNECEAAIANTRWNNIVAMGKRILNAAQQINSANSSMQLEIVENYVALKIEELHLAHEYREQLKIEKEERTELARAEREEKKLLAEAAAAEKKEAEYQKLLDKARAEAGTDQSRIDELEAQLAEARDVSERARAMAEMTKSGYVYVISNIGSFGDEVVKIGLTRRLDPNDRVKELGDASVPFGFDTHAMVYSDEAPALEKALHHEFSERRINMSNMRKEFFHVSLAEVEDAVKRLAPDANFFTDREAQEWHETVARRRDNLQYLQESQSDELPEEI